MLRSPLTPCWEYCNERVCVSECVISRRFFPDGGQTICPARFGRFDFQLAWSDLLVFYSNLDLKMHRFGAEDMGRTDKQTYGSIA